MRIFHANIANMMEANSNTTTSANTKVDPILFQKSIPNEAAKLTQKKAGRPILWVVGGGTWWHSPSNIEETGNRKIWKKRMEKYAYR